MAFIEILLLLVSTISLANFCKCSTTTTTTITKSRSIRKKTIFIFNEYNSRSGNNAEKYATLVSVVKGKAKPDYNLCAIIIYHQDISIVRNDRMISNIFSGLGHYIEMVPAVINNTGMFASKDAIQYTTTKATK
jgi:hypothetical protein